MNLQAEPISYWDMNKNRFETCEKEEHRLYLAIKQPCPCYRDDSGKLVKQLWYDTTNNVLKIYTSKGHIAT